MKVGLRLLHLHGDVGRTTAVVEEADRLGFESAWLPEHLVMPAQPEDSPESGHAGGVAADWPWFDPFVYLAHLGARAPHIRLGTAVYVLGLRNPFTAARAIQTLDVVTGGRAEVGVGAGWQLSEWQAVGVDTRRRGRRLEEVLLVCRRLWTEDPVEHHGEWFDFGPVRFLPKPVQPGGPPIHIGGETDVALERAARLGDGWIGRDHTPTSVRPLVERLHQLLEHQDRDPAAFEVTVRATGTDASPDEWARAGVTRILVSPWPGEGRGITDVEVLLAGVHDFAARHGAGEPPRGGSST